MVRLLPREEVFITLFNESAPNILEAARKRQVFLDDFRDVAKRAEEIKALEDKGDDLTHGIIDRLNRTFVAPLDREDTFDLAKQLDDVIDWIEGALSRIAVYHVAGITPEARGTAPT